MFSLPHALVLVSRDLVALWLFVSPFENDNVFTTSLAQFLNLILSGKTISVCKQTVQTCFANPLRNLAKFYPKPSLGNFTSGRAYPLLSLIM